QLNEQLEGWADEFGGDFELAVFGKRVIFVTKTEDARRIYVSRPTKFVRGWFPDQFFKISKKVGLNPSLFFDEGKEWGRSRRLISPALNGHQNVADMIPAITKIAERVCTKLGDQQGEMVDVAPIFERFTHDVIALAGFGFDADSVRATADRPSVSYQAMGNILEALMALLMDPLTVLGWTIAPSLWPLARTTKEGSARLHHVVQGAIDSTRRQMESSGGMTPPGETGGALLRKLVSARNKNSDNSVNDAANRMTLSDEEIVTEVKMLFLAGSETTAKTLSWTLYFLAKHPEMLLRCREEALRVAPLSGGMVSSFEQASQLLFCSVVFKETLRIRPPATVLFLHNTEAFTMKSGMELEAGTAFTTLLRYPCLSNDAFTRAKEFVPERWIDAEREEALLGKRSADDDSSGKVVHREEVTQFFGGGPRICPGMHIANLEAAIFLGAVCARFDVALAPSQADPPQEKMQFTTGLNSLKLVLTPRKA
ncbi:unnamed protein product, partial [Scytosiphon promiscuus]